MTDEQAMMFAATGHWGPEDRRFANVQLFLQAHMFGVQEASGIGYAAAGLQGLLSEYGPEAETKEIWPLLQMQFDHGLQSARAKIKANCVGSGLSLLPHPAIPMEPDQ